MITGRNETRKESCKTEKMKLSSNDPSCPTTGHGYLVHELPEIPPETPSAISVSFLILSCLD